MADYYLEGGPFRERPHVVIQLITITRLVGQHQTFKDNRVAFRILFLVLYATHGPKRL